MPGEPRAEPGRGATGSRSWALEAWSEVREPKSGAGAMTQGPWPEGQGASIPGG